MRIKKVVIEKANRLFQLPPDLASFFRTEKKPTFIKKTHMLDLASLNWPIRFDSEYQIDPSGLKPATEAQLSELAEDLANWLNSTHGAKIVPAREIYIGSRISNTLLNLSLALVDPGDLVLVPDLAVPHYRSATAACNGQAVTYHLDPKRDYKPDIESINSRIGRVVRLMFLNSPHNPTGTELSSQDLEYLVYYASRENIALINDAAYQSLPGRKQASLLGVTGGKNVGAEVYSFAYLFGLPDIGLGFMAGNREIINALNSSDRLNRSFIPGFYLDLIRRAIRQYPGEGVKSIRQTISKSASEAAKFLELLSLEKTSQDNTPFLWAKITRRGRASNAASILYRRSRIMTTPGTAFGESGEGFLRFSLTASPEEYREACGRVKSRRNMLKIEGDE
ncbi:MAG: pyridoxal phosphate-dependent aminotransferase [bacterium]|nr:pyridoxal phosphate-dependent aminotransferase [bacterium]